MTLKECAFCEAPAANLDENGWCATCHDAFKILEQDEIEEIQNRTGFKRQTPEKEFPGV